MFQRFYNDEYSQITRADRYNYKIDHLNVDVYSVEYYCIPANHSHKRDACLFLEFLSSLFTFNSSSGVAVSLALTRRTWIFIGNFQLLDKKRIFEVQAIISPHKII